LFKTIKLYKDHKLHNFLKLCVSFSLSLFYVKIGLSRTLSHTHSLTVCNLISNYTLELPPCLPLLWFIFILLYTPLFGCIIVQRKLPVQKSEWVSEREKISQPNKPLSVSDFVFWCGTSLSTCSSYNIYLFVI
jgi:hypothetical protein